MQEIPEPVPKSLLRERGMKQEKIWGYFQGDGVQIFSDSHVRLNYLFRRAERISGGRRLRILNIGVGNGWMERRCLGQKWDTCSLDPSEQAIGKLVLEGVGGKVGYVEEIPFPDRVFDVVFCSEVLEHLASDAFRTGLQEIWRVLKDGGVLIGTVPYKEDFENNMAVCPDCGKVFHRWGHMQVFDRAKLAEYLERSGLKVVAMRTKSFLNLSGLKFAGKAKVSLHLLLGRIGLTIASPSLYFQARKPPPAAD